MNDWVDGDMPWVENENFPKAVVEKVAILELLDSFKLEYTPCSSGDFTHKMKCPFPIHADGQERTASCYVSETTNKFYCFGCNNGGSVIDFVKLYLGKPFGETLKWLGDFAGITSSDVSKETVPKEKKDPEKTISVWVMRAGLEIRKHLENQKGKAKYNKWCEWSDRQFEKLDSFMNLSDKEWETAKQYYDRLMIFLDTRCQKK